jgi:hypothetical protein
MRIKLFESFKEEEYYVKSRYHSNEEYRDFTKADLDKIIEYLDSRGFSQYRDSGSNTRKYYINEFSNKDRFIFLQVRENLHDRWNGWHIIPLDDEYYEIRSSFNAYTCDQIEGVIKYIEDKILN